MKLTIVVFFLAGFFLVSCNTDKKTNAKQDSLEAAAAADSMLKEALKADSLNADSL